MGRLLLRLAIGLVGLVVCFQLIALAGAAGVSRFFSANSVIYSSLEPADVAVKLAPSDPEAHYAKGVALTNLNRLNEAKAAFERAIQLRPNYYYQWLDLGVTLDRLEDSAGAISAIRESIRLAPSFSQPHWQLGNLLYSQGHYDEAFAELRKGAESNTRLTPGMLDLAWVAANGDVAKMESFIQPPNGRRHLELAAYLARQGKGDDAARHVSEAGQIKDPDELGLLHLTILTLLSTNQYRPAYLAWAPQHNVSGVNLGKLVNGNFTESIIQDDPGFGWQVATVPTASVSIDPAGPNGGRSLRLQFNGENSPSDILIHQLILPRPNTRYSLVFSAKNQDLVTGGPPIIVVLDVTGDPPTILGRSIPLSGGPGNWTSYTVDFSTGEKTTAIKIGLQRLFCTESPCPIFGKLWLGQFSLNSRS